ncbi:hypothetical protein EAY39_07850 [Vibrio anguillarum]|uniref:hypothetical protein n=1 Tax=Vibrio anguillarum TaxID=55601 RepID=UPI0018C25BD0|nr:hypothetical protein [Vibrio anguillarum]MBF4340700.1 hypothetical protein [Vibrio anguillarum]
MAIQYGAKGRTKSGVDYSISNDLVSFSSIGINTMHKPSEVSILTFEDIKEPIFSHWIAQTGTSSNGVTVRLTEAEADLLAEALNTTVKRI